MHVEIQSSTIELTEALRQYVRKRLSFALGAREATIERVMVRLADVNGPKGGKDSYCHVQISLKQLPDVVIKQVEADIFTAVDRAAGRVDRTVSRRLARKTLKKRAQSLRRRLRFHDELEFSGDLLLQ